MVLTLETSIPIPKAVVVMTTRSGDKSGCETAPCAESIRRIAVAIIATRAREEVHSLSGSKAGFRQLQEAERRAIQVIITNKM